MWRTVRWPRACQISLRTHSGRIGARGNVSEGFASETIMMSRAVSGADAHLHCDGSKLQSIALAWVRKTCYEGMASESIAGMCADNGAATAHSLLLHRVHMLMRQQRCVQQNWLAKHIATTLAQSKGQ